MKKKLLILTVICVLFSLVCGCAHEIPEYLPGENEGDSHFVWLCQEPFGFFSTAYDTTRCHNGLLKGYIEKEGEFVCFYSEFDRIDGRTYFQEEKNWGDPSKNDSFDSHADYYENYFELEIYCDYVNFFGGELPTLRFDKMTKQDFIEQHGDIENVSELLQVETTDIDEVS